MRGSQKRLGVFSGAYQATGEQISVQKQMVIIVICRRRRRKIEFSRKLCPDIYIISGGDTGDLIPPSLPGLHNFRSLDLS